MHKIINALLVFLIILFISSCAGTPTLNNPEKVSYRTLLSRNRANLNSLSIGMTKSQVRNLMGKYASETRNGYIPNPYSTEVLTKGDTQYEALYFLTKKYPPFTSIRLSQAIPVVLKNGQVMGWGHETWQKVNN